MHEIAAAGGEIIIVDAEDFALLGELPWHITRGGYARRSIPHPRLRGRQVWQQIHRAIMGLAYGDPRQVDHINGNKLDNRRCNLRVCTKAENVRNRGAQANNVTGLKGVCLHRGKWKAQISHRGRRRDLGYFASPQLAHEFYCLAADLLHGEFARHA
ncbi:hypothetical protein QkW1_14 [Ralstonia phage QkW1]